MSEKRSKTVTWADPMIGAGRAREMSGLAYMQALCDGTIPLPPISRLLNMQFVAVGEGWIDVALQPDESHYNPIGSVHGGPIATVLDSATACAVHSTLPAGTGYTTLELKVNYVRAVSTETGLLTCRGVVIHRGRRVATSEAHLRDKDGKLYAHATSTCMIFASSGTPR